MGVLILVLSFQISVQKERSCSHSCHREATGCTLHYPSFALLPRCDTSLRHSTCCGCEVDVRGSAKGRKVEAAGLCPPPSRSRTLSSFATSPLLGCAWRLVSMTQPPSQPPSQLLYRTSLLLQNAESDNRTCIRSDIFKWIRACQLCQSNSRTIQLCATFNVLDLTDNSLPGMLNIESTCPGSILAEEHTHGRKSTSQPTTTASVIYDAWTCCTLQLALR